MKIITKALANVPLVISALFVGMLVMAAGSGGCTAIQSGTITDVAGNVITTGFDKFGYNYQAHDFNGTYDSVDRTLDGTYYGQTADYVDDQLRMKWSDSWLSNKDCNDDHKLDRGLMNGVVGGISKGWLTNQVEGDYMDGGGTLRHYTNLIKIGWTGTGSPLWGEYTVLQEIYNDPAGGFHGPAFKAATPGFGLNDHRTQ